MKSIQTYLLFAFTLLAASTVAWADDTEALAGKWSTTKTGAGGEKVTQTLEVKKDKFVFEVQNADAQVVIHAEGELKLEKLGPFKVAKFVHIRAGASSSDLNDVDDEYVSVYTLRDDNWIMASNFDKEREGQAPSTDIYRKVKEAAGKSVAK